MPLIIFKIDTLLEIQTFIIYSFIQNTIIYCVVRKTGTIVETCHVLLKKILLGSE